MSWEPVVGDMFYKLQEVSGRTEAVPVIWTGTEWVPFDSAAGAEVIQGLKAAAVV